MSDDYFFGEDDFDDSAFIAGFDAFEATHNHQHAQQTTDSSLAPASSKPGPKSPPPAVITISDDEEFKFDDSFDLGDVNRETRQLIRTSSGKLQQQTLWGLPAPPDNRHKLPLRQKGKTIKKTKTWDRTEYAKSGWRVIKKGKDKAKNQVDEELHNEEPVEFEQFPQPTNLGEAHTCLASVAG